jgi:2-phosphosulfolactate phosphatase
METDVVPAAAVVDFGWGRRGVERAAGPGRIVIIVDVLRFSTAVEVATARGAMVVPCPWRDQRAAELAHERNAFLADDSRQGEAGALNLSPVSISHIAAGTRIVLPSPNGSELSFLAAASGATVVAGCLRNAAAVAEAASAMRGQAAVIAAGERWPDGGLRPAIEDLLGAGAIIAALEGRHTPEAEVAASAFRSCRDGLERLLTGCLSGEELVHRGLRGDVRMAAGLDAGGSVPILREGAFEPWWQTGTADPAKV